ncbi:hypothetical protein D3C78_1445910 [compost metagenome]
MLVRSSMVDDMRTMSLHNREHLIRILEIGNFRNKFNMGIPVQLSKLHLNRINTVLAMSEQNQLIRQKLRDLTAYLRANRASGSCYHNNLLGQITGNAVNIKLNRLTTQ